MPTADVIHVHPASGPCAFCLVQQGHDVPDELLVTPPITSRELHYVLTRYRQLSPVHRRLTRRLLALLPPHARPASALATDVDTGDLQGPGKLLLIRPATRRVGDESV